MFREHDFDAAKNTEHDVVGDETENKSANRQTVVVENQHKNSLEEIKLMKNANFDAPKKPVSVLDFKPLNKAIQFVKK